MHGLYSSLEGRGSDRQCKGEVVKVWRIEEWRRSGDSREGGRGGGRREKKEEVGRKRVVE